MLKSEEGKAWWDEGRQKSPTEERKQNSHRSIMLYYVMLWWNSGKTTYFLIYSSSAALNSSLNLFIFQNVRRWAFECVISHGCDWLGLGKWNLWQKLYIIFIHNPPFSSMFVILCRNYIVKLICVIYWVKL